MHRIGMAVGIVLVVATVIVAVFLTTFHVNRYRGTIQSQLESRLVRKVTLGEMHLTTFPPRFRVANLAVAEDPAFATGRPLCTGSRTRLVSKAAAASEGCLAGRFAQFAASEYRSGQNRQGAWNFSSLGHAPESTASSTVVLPPGKAAATGGQPAATGSSGGSAFKLLLASVDITDGQLAVTDLQAGKPRVLYEHLDANLGDFTPGGPVVSDQPVATPFHGTLDLKQVEMAALRQFLNSKVLTGRDGVLSGHTQVTGKSGTVVANGKATVEKARIGGRSLGYTITATYQISNDVTTDVFVFRNTTITLGRTPVVVNGTVAFKPASAQVDLRLKADNVSITQAARLATALGTGLAPGTTVTGTMSATLRAQWASDKLALTGSIAGRNIEITGKDVPQAVRVKSINLALAPTEIQSDHFNLTSAATTLAVQFTLRQYLSKSPFLDATLRATDAGLPLFPLCFQSDKRFAVHC